MDDIDREILQLIQEDFPLVERPFMETAVRLGSGVDESEVMRRISALKENGVIRRIGAVVDGKAVGVVTTLLGAVVPEDAMAGFVDAVNSYPRVTHNYLRSGERNIWFTLWGKSMEEIEETVDEIRKNTGITDIMSFPSKKTYKIRAVFDIPDRL